MDSGRYGCVEGGRFESCRNHVSRTAGHASTLAGALKDGLKGIEEIQFTGSWTQRLPGHVSLVVNYVEGESLLLMLDMKNICAASGSSCTSKDLKISPVLTAMGLDQTVAQGSLVFSSVIDSTMDDVEVVVKELPDIVARLREMSPLWSRKKETM
jgi:cysteine desulfurase